MPLSPTEFVPREFYSLLTGAMADQPVTLSNTLSVGGDQKHSEAGLRVYGGIDLYASRQDSSPGFAIGPGGFSWDGALFAPAPQGGLRVGPRLEVVGDLVVGGTIQGELPWDEFFSNYLRDLRPGTIAMNRGLVIGNVDPWQTGLSHAQAQLVVRSQDLSYVSQPLSLLCWAGNWLQFNVRFWEVDPTQGWPGKSVTLDFDADNMTAGSGGRITLGGGKVGIGRVTDVEGAILALQEKVG